MKVLLTTLGVIFLFVILISVFAFGIRQLKKREKEKDETVTKITEEETEKPEVKKAAGIKKITKILSKFDTLVIQEATIQRAQAPSSLG